MVPRSRDSGSHRWRTDLGAAHYAGLANAAKREQETAGPAAADALPLALQLSRTPFQGAGCKVGLGVHGARQWAGELLSDLRQNEASRAQSREDPLPRALGHVQWSWETGVRMTVVSEL